MSLSLTLLVEVLIVLSPLLLAVLELNSLRTREILGLLQINQNTLICFSDLSVLLGGDIPVNIWMVLFGHFNHLLFQSVFIEGDFWVEFHNSQLVL